MNRLAFFILLLLNLTNASAQTEEVKTDYMWGKYENGEKVGNWQYFDTPGELSLMINYSTGKFSYIKKDTANYMVQLYGVWLESKVVSPPRFLGSKHDLYDFLSKNIKFPKNAISSGISGQTAISFIIDEKGSAGNFEVIKDLSGGCTEEVLRVLTVVPNTWIQAVTTLGEVPSKMIVVVNFGVNKHYKPTKREKMQHPFLYKDRPYIINLDLYSYTVIREVRH